MRKEIKEENVYVKRKNKRRLERKIENERRKLKVKKRKK